MNKWRLAVILLLLVTAAMFVGLLALRTVRAPQPAAPRGPAAGSPQPTPTVLPEYEAENQAFRVRYPPGWQAPPRGQEGWWFFRHTGEPADDEGAPVTPPPPPPTPTPPAEAEETDYLEPLDLGPGPLVALSYAPLGDPQRDPEDAVYRWFLEVESWLPWALPQDSDEPLWETPRTLTVGEGQYPAAQADFAWDDTPFGPIRGRMVLVKVYGQVWAFVAYAPADEWPTAEQALQTMLQNFYPAPDPPPHTRPGES